MQVSVVIMKDTLCSSGCRCVLDVEETEDGSRYLRDVLRMQRW